MNVGRSVRVAVGAVLVAGWSTVCASPSGADVVVPAASGPPQDTRSSATAYAESHPGSSPEGANDFGCRLSPQHPRPVVLAHGTDASAYGDWAKLAPMLVQEHYCVFTPNYGASADGSADAESYGTGDVAASAADFGRFVDTVLSATGAASVDVVGYSQGANVTRYYVNRLGGHDHVDRWIGLASPTYGGTTYGVGPALHAVPGGDAFMTDVTSVAVLQQLEGSEFLQKLNGGGDTVPGVEYTTVGSRYDEMIQPYTNQALRDPGAHNIIVQDLCPQNASGHFRAPYDPFTLDLVRTALDPASVPRSGCEFVPLGADIPAVVLDSNS